MMPPLQINAERLRSDFEALSRIGATAEGGVSRPALSEAHLAARAWFRERAAAGLEVNVDPAGNHSAVLRQPGARKTLLLGSHLDSVPQGGNYDGSIGVLAALEVLRTIKEAELLLPVNLEAIDFTDEEGTLVGALGSEALAGLLKEVALRHPRGGRAALEAGLARAGLKESHLLEARRDPQSLAGFLELHIEQGPRLDQAGVSIGVVTGIVGSRSFWFTFEGRANHAGTTPMSMRADAGVAASAFVVAIRKIVLEQFPQCVATVGQMTFEPGAFNIIPARARHSLEFRSVDGDALENLKTLLLERACSEAKKQECRVAWEQVANWNPVAMHPAAQAAILQSAKAQGVETLSMPSGAGHDAQSLAHITPTGMIFVPSVKGISHHPDEYTEWAHCVQGANVLLGAVIRMATQHER
jgi:N-carbamoyl-L-amino-acid hydrolase